MNYNSKWSQSYLGVVRQMIAVYNEFRGSILGNIICKLSFWCVCQNDNIITEGGSVCPNDYNITWGGGVSLGTPKSDFLIYVRPLSPQAAHFYWNSGEKRERWAFQTVGKKVRIQEYMNAHLCLPTCLLPKPFLFVCLLFVESVHQGSR